MEKSGNMWFTFTLLTSKNSQKNNLEPIKVAILYNDDINRYFPGCSFQDQSYQTCIFDGEGQPELWF